MDIKTVGVLGCGLMGSGIAQVCAAAGYKTIVREVDQAVLDKGLGRTKKFLDGGVDASPQRFRNRVGRTQRPSMTSQVVLVGQSASLRQPPRGKQVRVARSQSSPSGHSSISWWSGYAAGRLLKAGRFRRASGARPLTVRIFSSGGLLPRPGGAPASPSIRSPVRRPKRRTIPWLTNTSSAVAWNPSAGERRNPLPLERTSMTPRTAVPAARGSSAPLRE